MKKKTEEVPLAVVKIYPVLKQVHYHTSSGSDFLDQAWSDMVFHFNIMWSRHDLSGGNPSMILDDILRWKMIEVEEAKKRISPETMREAALSAPPPLDFHAAISEGKTVSVIAEVKKASPSRGTIREDFDPVALARRYEECGAAAVSVLTDERFFQGSLEYLRHIRGAVRLPLLRKDFIIDEYQINEARAAGADAVLLITGMIDAGLLGSLYRAARGLCMSVLVETHTEEEAAEALSIRPRIIGVNNRNLKDFSMDMDRTARVGRMISPGVCLVSESGIRTREDMEYLARCGARAALVGETLMRAEDPGTALKDLLGISVAG